MTSNIWKAFNLMNSGKLRSALETDHIDNDTIQATIDIIGREEYRINRLIASKGKRRF